MRDSDLEQLVEGDGGMAQVAYPGDPKAIVLGPREIVTLEITPPTVSPVGLRFQAVFDRYLTPTSSRTRAAR